MPQMRFKVRWPDGTVMSCYSPSLVVKDFLSVGHAYTVADFVSRSSESLTIGSERVKAKFGFYCTGASDQLQSILATAERFKGIDGAEVTVESFDE